MEPRAEEDCEARTVRPRHRHSHNHPVTVDKGRLVRDARSHPQQKIAAPTKPGGRPVWLELGACEWVIVRVRDCVASRLFHARARLDRSSPQMSAAHTCRATVRTTDHGPRLSVLQETKEEFGSTRTPLHVNSTKRRRHAREEVVQTCIAFENC